MGKPAQIDIVRRAYEPWQKAGGPQGRDQEFYHQAEKELQQAFDKSTPRPMDKNCTICFGIGWVCEKHPDRA